MGETWSIGTDGIDGRGSPATPLGEARFEELATRRGTLKGEARHRRGTLSFLRNDEGTPLPPSGNPLVLGPLRGYPGSPCPPERWILPGWVGVPRSLLSLTPFPHPSSQFAPVKNHGLGRQNSGFGRGEIAVWGRYYFWDPYWPGPDGTLTQGGGGSRPYHSAYKGFPYQIGPRKSSRRGLTPYTGTGYSRDTGAGVAPLTLTPPPP